MKKYKVFYSPTIIVLLVAVFLLAVGGLVWNIYNLISYVNLDTVKVVTYSVILALNVVVVVFALLIAINSFYKIDGKNLSMTLGFITTKLSVDDITEIVFFKKNSKLVIYYGKDDKFAVVLISPEKYDSFTDDMRKINSKIGYAIETDIIK